MLTAAEVEDVLAAGAVGRIGCVSAGRPYVVPVCYAYSDGFVHGHTMPGAKRSALEANGSICFEVEEIVDLSHWRSVIAWGTAEFLAGTAAASAFDLLLDRLAPMLGEDFRTVHERRSVTQSAPPGVYRILLQEKTGRFER